MDACFAVVKKVSPLDTAEYFSLGSEEFPASTCVLIIFREVIVKYIFCPFGDRDDTTRSTCSSLDRSSVRLPDFVSFHEINTDGSYSS